MHARFFSRYPSALLTSPRTRSIRTMRVVVTGAFDVFPGSANSRIPRVRQTARNNRFGCFGDRSRKRGPLLLAVLAHKFQNILTQIPPWTRTETYLCVIHKTHAVPEPYVVQYFKIFASVPVTPGTRLMTGYREILVYSLCTHALSGPRHFAELPRLLCEKGHKNGRTRNEMVRSCRGKGQMEKFVYSGMVFKAKS